MSAFEGMNVWSALEHRVYDSVGTCEANQRIGIQRKRRSDGLFVAAAVGGSIRFSVGHLEVAARRRNAQHFTVRVVRLLYLWRCVRRIGSSPAFNQAHSSLSLSRRCIRVTRKTKKN